ncbi:FAD-binding domain-containing protein [Eremomyces bilateralis CBS 781.70]|uniref:FAD-binding domain-containing protein n=1 Tax=Eremomyces bilateralis CBS 781.70 TaxID=1392243 RepID=A0A6G1GFL7_9PEZI|nr:FAD-binding domain-containing protein [Eremomyces bilateralis CBS 781.70]KAF1816877.1 FAD-binding domain-containing protein [Eremomyces bilateralis CBS 781.70]
MVKVQPLLVWCALAIGSSAEIQSVSTPPEAVESEAQKVLQQDGAAPCAHACSSLTLDLPQKVFLGHDGGFAMWDAKQHELVPACRVVPTSAEDIVAIIEAAKSNQCHFAIKSGGHSRMAGASNAEGGITIDLEKLTSIELAKDQKSVTIGAGARWGEIYTTLEKESLTVIGGRVADVGIGGLVLGGGISFFSGVHGLACDNVISYEIVLPTGKIVKVSENENSDLFWALRGGGSSNFGVVTSFVLETKELLNPNGLWYSNRMHTPDKLPDLTAARHQWMEGLGEDQRVGGYDVYAYSGMHGMSLMASQHIHLDHADPTTSPPLFNAYDPIEALQEVDITRVMPMSNITKEVSDMSPYNMRYSYSTFTRKPDMALDEKIMGYLDEVAEEIKHIPGVVATFIMQALSKDALSHTKRRGGNSLGLRESDGPLAINSISWMWASAEFDELMQSQVQSFVRKSEQAAKDAGLWHPFKYINYAEKWQEADVLAGFGETNLKKLRGIQRKYDPEGVFTKGGLCGGYFMFNEKLGRQEVRDEL